jgi:hypothetical protein
MVTRSRDDILADLRAGLSAQLWQDQETARLLILSGEHDIRMFGERIKEGAFAQGLSLVVEILDTEVVNNIHVLNQRSVSMGELIDRAKVE